MIGRAELLGRFGLPPVLLEDSRQPAEAAPWYVALLIGASAWIAALVALVFVGFLFADMIDDAPVALLVIGALLLGGGGVVVWRDPSGAFLGQAATAVGVAGAGLMALGAALVLDETIGAAATGAAIALIVAWLVPARIFQGVITLLALSVIAVVAAEESDDLIPLVAALTTVAGTVLLLLPARRAVEPSANVLLVFGPGLAAAGWWLPDVSADPWSLLAAKVMLTLALLGVFAAAPKWAPMLGRKTLLILPAFLFTAAIIMPYSGAAALVVLAVAYARGAPALAVLGALLLINATWRSYYDLSVDLLTKSAALAAVGILLIGLWATLKPDGRSHA